MRWLLLGVMVVGACERPCDEDTCDQDGDGLPAAEDCDDLDADVGPGDQYFADCDGDGVAGELTVVSCGPPEDAPCDGGGIWRGADEPRGDCNDDDATVQAVAAWAPDCDGDGLFANPIDHCGEPGAPETQVACGIDEADWSEGVPTDLDCDDGDVSVGVGTWYPDCDGDDWYADAPHLGCDEPDATPCDGAAPVQWRREAPLFFDCDDRDPARSDLQSWWADCDGDGVPGEDVAQTCGAPLTTDSPCVDDADPDGGWQSAPPTPPDCDDEDAGATAPDRQWFPDCDGDGAFAATPILSCHAPANACASPGGPLGGWTHDAPTMTDCDDDDPTTFIERDWFPDCDGDGATAPLHSRQCAPPVIAGCADILATPSAEFDCDDADASRSPTFFETPYNLIDDDCDPATLDDDLDGDGFGMVSDCDDADRNAYPGAPDAYGDGIDSDCDGDDVWPADASRGLYVAKYGSDSNPGTPDLPFLTVGMAASLASDGDIVFVAEGTYEESVSGSISVVGGFSGDGNWTWDPDTYVTVLDAGVSATEPALAVFAGSEPLQITGLTIVGDGSRALTIGTEGDYTSEHPLAMHRVFVEGSAEATGWTGFGSNLDMTGKADRALYLTGPVTDVDLFDVVFDHSTPGVLASGGLYVRLGPTVHIERAQLGPAFTGLRIPEGDVTVVDAVVNGARNGIEIDRGTLELIDSRVTASDKGVDALYDPTVRIVRSVIRVTGDGSPTALHVANDATALVVSSALHGGFGGENLSGGGGGGGGALDYSSGARAIQQASLTIVGSYLDGGEGMAAFGVYSASTGPVLVHGTILSGGTASRAYGAGNSDTATLTLGSNLFDTSGTGLVGVGIGPFVLESVTELGSLHACAWSGCAGAADNVAGPLLLTDPDAGDYTPQAGSLTVDSGTPPPLDDPAIWQDLLGNPRPVGAWDIGPIEQ